MKNNNFDNYNNYLNIYAVYDSVADVFLQPYYMHDDKPAIRVFRDLQSDPESQLSKHPDDYELFVIGTYNYVTGVIFGTDPLRITNV